MFTKENIIAKFGGNKAEAEAFMAALIKSEEQKLKETEKLFDPKGKVMMELDEELGRAAYTAFAPMWKRALINFKLIKV